MRESRREKVTIAGEGDLDFMGTRSRGDGETETPGGVGQDLAAEALCARLEDKFDAAR